MNYGSDPELNCGREREKIVNRKVYLFPVEKSRFTIGVRFDTTNVMNICRTKRGHETVKGDLNKKQKPFRTTYSKVV